MCPCGLDTKTLGRCVPNDTRAPSVVSSRLFNPSEIQRLAVTDCETNEIKSIAKYPGKQIKCQRTGYENTTNTRSPGGRVSAGSRIDIFPRYCLLLIL